MKHIKFLKKGSVISFSCESHGSVGIYSEAKYDEHYFVYKSSSTVPLDCMPGGDDGYRTHYLQAIKRGITNVDIIEYFKDEITKKQSIIFFIR